MYIRCASLPSTVLWAFHTIQPSSLLLQSICARTEENVETVNDFVLSQEDKPQTHRTVREISREMGIHRSSVSRIIYKDLRLKCFKRRRAQELTDANCTAGVRKICLYRRSNSSHSELVSV